MTGSTECKITGFTVAAGGATYTGVINDAAHTVGITVPYGTAVTALTPTIAISANATISPASGVSQNFTNAVTYTVTAEDATTTQDYTATVTIAADATVATVGQFGKLGWAGVKIATGSLDAYTAGGVNIGLGADVAGVIGVQVAGGYIGFYDITAKKLKIYSAAGTEITDPNGLVYSVCVMTN